jgi:8-oxo-dGTP pyrophosphatase MutT (NUDIX family)
MNNRSLPDRIKKSLKGTLPGSKAHNLMSVIGHHSEKGLPLDCLDAGVMALFFPEGENWKLIFIKRSSRYHDDRHKGQIGFPGGKYEESDENIMTTALREVNEEIGVESGKIKVLGQLSKLYIPVSNFLVHPFVGVLDFVPEFDLQTQEVDELILSDFDTFFQKRIIKRTDIQIEKGIHLRNVPYYDLNGEVLWGATAMILTELFYLLESA